MTKTKLSKVFAAVKRIRFDTDEVIGVFSDRDQAENAIAMHLVKVKELRNFESNQDMFYQLSASWEVDEYELDSMNERVTYGMTETLLNEKITEIEKQ